MAVSVLAPVVLKITLQLPVPPLSEILQLLFAPVMATHPVGVGPAPLTVTFTVTVWPGIDGSGRSDVMVVVLLEGVTVVTLWLSVSELLAKVASPL